MGEARAWVLHEQLQPIRKLRGLVQGSRCELVPFLEEYDDGDDGDDGEGDDLQLESANSGRAVQVVQVRYPFDESAWPHTLAFILPPLCNVVLSRHSVLFWRNRGEVCASVRALLPPLLLLLFGLIMAPVCVWQTVSQGNAVCSLAGGGRCDSGSGH